MPRFSDEDSLKLENILKSIDEELEPETTAKESGAKPSTSSHDSDEDTVITISKFFQFTCNKSKTKVICRYSPHPPETPPEKKAGDLRNHLKNHGIVYGILEKNIQKAVSLIQQHPHAELEVVAVLGREPTPAQPARVSFWIGDHNKSEQNRETYVRKNDLLMQIEPESEGIQGMTVFGEEIEAPSSPQKRYEAGRNVYIDEQGDFYASVPGVVHCKNGIVYVLEIDRDSNCIVHTAKDEMSATISIEPPLGKGKKLTHHDIRMILSENGVCSGIDDEAIKKALLQVNQKGLAVEDCLVAKGRLSQQGKDAGIKWHENPNQSKERYIIDSNGSINFYSLKSITSITEGTHLLTYIPPTKGKDGFTITGSRLEGKQGKPLSFRAGDNIQKSQDGIEWYAGCSGKYQLYNNILEVQPLYYVDGDVDFSAGNIDFIGDVVINGNILDGFEVKATGHITVQGTIEAAFVEAGKNVEVRQGIFGKEKGMVIAGQDIISSFLQNADVDADRNIIVSNQILNSTVCALRNIEVKTGKGSIIGGTAIAGHQINARTVGTEYGTKTVIEVGTNYQVLQDMNTISLKKTNLESQQKILEDFLSKKKEQLTSLSDTDSEKDALLNTALRKRDQLKQVISHLAVKYRDLAKNLYTTDTPKIHARAGIMPGVILRIRDVRQKINSPLKNCLITYDVEENKIILKTIRSRS